jgi:uncharacterized membrane protein
MGIFLTLYFISLPVFILVDLLWLGVIAKDFYQTKLAHLLGEISWTPALIFYSIFLFGLTHFVIYPSVALPLRTVALQGALFGFVTYATYDLTNQALLRDWPYMVTIIDILWGTFLGAFVATATVFIYKSFVL